MDCTLLLYKIANLAISFSAVLNLPIKPLATMFICAFQHNKKLSQGIAVARKLSKKNVRYIRHHHNAG